MSGKNVCITGPTKGIGLETARQLARKNANLYLLCRNTANGEEIKEQLISETSNPNIFVHQLDVSNMNQIRQFAESFPTFCNKLDVLINNAGAMYETKKLTEEGNELTMATAIGGTFLLTALLLPMLKNASPARVINVSSGGMYNVKARENDLNSEGIAYDGTLVYALAKRAQVMLTELWSEKLQDSGIFFYSMHPGWVDTPGVRTAMPKFYRTYQNQLRSAEEGADTIVWLAASPNALTQSGRFWFDRAPQKTHMRFARTQSSPEEYQTLWESCERFCNYKFSG